MVAGRTLVAWSMPVALAATLLAAACGSDDGDARPSLPKGDAAAPPVSDAGIDAAPLPFCVDGKPTVAYPPGPYEVALTSAPPPDLAWDGPDGAIAIKDYFEPCAPRSRLLVIRTSTAWCGTCDWHARHTKKLLGDERFADRVLLLDLLVADRDNMPITMEATADFRTRIDAPAKIAMDPGFTFRTVPGSESPLPEYVIIDTKTMRIRTVDADPSPKELATKLRLELALLDGQPRPASEDEARYDDLFSENQWDMIKAMRLVDAPPPDPTNEFADSPAAAAFGKLLFSDTGLSSNGAVSCASCHDAAKGFGDGTAQSTGLSRLDRNSPSVALAAHARWQFWDGRADTLWMQALIPPETAKEMNSSRLAIAHHVATTYAAEYASVFGPKYTMPDLTGLPAEGKPGDASYDALPVTTRDAITRVYVNVGKAIAAFERSLRVAPNALDAYAGGDKNALGASEKEALHTFFTLGCAQCHWGPRLTDDAFHALRFPTGRQDGNADLGRFEVLGSLASAELVATSKWSDAPSAAKPLVFGAAPAMRGAFKTPALRGVAQTAPYGHGGMYAELFDVAQHYGQRGRSVTTSKTAGDVEAWVPAFDINAQTQLVKLLRVLTATPLP